MIDIDNADQILQGDDTHADILQALGLVLLDEVKRLREQLDNVRYWVSSHEDEHMMEIFKIWIGEEE